MKKFSFSVHQLRSLLTVSVAIAFAYSSGALAANCWFNQGSSFTANFGSKPINLTIPKDAPIGTVVYQESITAPNQSFACSVPSPFIFALDPRLGHVTSGNVFPLGKTGLSLKVKNDQNGYLNADRILPSGSYTDASRAYTIEIIKSSEQPSQNEVPAGYLGAHILGNLNLVKINLLNPLILNASSCQTPSVSVQMGDDYRLEEFSKSGDTPRIIKFNISLNQCQSGINKVTYSLQATTPVIDKQKAIVALSPNSTAKGIGLELMDDAGQPIALDTTYPFNGFNTTGKDFNIPLSAAYYRLANGKLEPGTANASVTFIVNYL